MQRPMAVTILAVLAVVCAIYMGWGGVASLRPGAALPPEASATADHKMTSMILRTTGVITLAFAALFALAALGLWKMKNWGRILTIVLVAVGLVSSLLGLAVLISHFKALLLVRELAVLALDIVILIYLLRPSTKQAFVS